MRIMIVTDAWLPQTNGVVNTLSQTALWLGRNGHDVQVVTPGDFPSLPCPTYPEIRVCFIRVFKVGAAHRCLSTRGTAHRDGGPTRVCRAPLLHLSESAVHKFLSHAFSAIPAIAPADSDVTLVPCIAHFS
jgi:hypothetical protein